MASFVGHDSLPHLANGEAGMVDVHSEEASRGAIVSSFEASWPSSFATPADSLSDSQEDLAWNSDTGDDGVLRFDSPGSTDDVSWDSGMFELETSAPYELSEESERSLEVFDALPSNFSGHGDVRLATSRSSFAIRDVSGDYVAKPSTASAYGGAWVGSEDATEHVVSGLGDPVVGSVRQHPGLPETSAALPVVTTAGPPIPEDNAFDNTVLHLLLAILGFVLLALTVLFVYLRRRCARRSGGAMGRLRYSDLKTLDDQCSEI